MKKYLVLIISVFLSVVIFTPAFAVPALQMYIEGATYDYSSESWLTTSHNFVLWTLGDVGKYGTIYDVRLVAAYDSDQPMAINITPTTATGLYDPSTPIDPIYKISGDGTEPTFTNDKDLPAHGVYGPGVSWDNYALGNFSLTDSPIGDYIGTIPTEYPDMGQVNAYEISVDGHGWVHFDLFDHYVSKNGGKFEYRKAPFSHDAEVAPEPSTLSLLGMGLLGLLGIKRKK